MQMSYKDENKLKELQMIWDSSGSFFIYYIREQGKGATDDIDFIGLLEIPCQARNDGSFNVIAEFGGDLGKFFGRQGTRAICGDADDFMCEGGADAAGCACYQDDFVFHDRVVSRMGGICQKLAVDKKLKMSIIVIRRRYINKKR